MMVEQRSLARYDLRSFVQVGYELPDADANKEFAFQRLIDTFMSPSEATPRELLDALFLVDEMSTHEGMDALIEAASREEIPLDDGDEHSPADIAIQVWLRNSEILERKHAEQFLFKPKSFEYYQTDCDEPPVFTSLRSATRQAIERDLDNWFEEKRRGRGCRVFAYPDDHQAVGTVDCFRSGIRGSDLEQFRGKPQESKAARSPRS